MQAASEKSLTMPSQAQFARRRGESTIFRFPGRPTSSKNEPKREQVAPQHGSATDTRNPCQADVQQDDAKKARGG